MTKKIILLSLCASVSVCAQSEVKRLKTQLAQQTETTQSLQERIDALETQSNASVATYSQKSFLPDISLIVDSSYVSRSEKDEALKHLEIPGIAHGIMGEHSHGGGHSHAPLNAHDGFNLNYAELALYSNIDPYLSLTGIFHLSENSFEV